MSLKWKQCGVSPNFKKLRSITFDNRHLLFSRKKMKSFLVGKKDKQRCINKRKRWDFHFFQIRFSKIFWVGKFWTLKNVVFKVPVTSKHQKRHILKEKTIYSHFWFFILWHFFKELIMIRDAFSTQVVFF